MSHLKISFDKLYESYSIMKGTVDKILCRVYIQLS